MAGRNWDRLGEAQRKRYLSYGRKRGLSETEVRAHYMSGGTLQGWTGHGGGARRDWAALSDRQKKRYLSFGKKRGLSADDVRQHYTTGGSLDEYRGQHDTESRPKSVMPSTWKRLMQAAKESRLYRGGTDPALVLESLLEKGYGAQWILAQLKKQKESRDTYLSDWGKAMRRLKLGAGWEPGRTRFLSRDIVADVEVYYYH